MSVHRIIRDCILLNDPIKLIEMYNKLDNNMQKRTLSQVMNGLLGIKSESSYSKLESLLSQNNINANEVNNLENGIILIKYLLYAKDDVLSAISAYTRLKGLGKVRRKHISLVADYLYRIDRYDEAIDIFHTYIVPSWPLHADDLQIKGSYERVLNVFASRNSCIELHLPVYMEAKQCNPDGTFKDTDMKVNKICFSDDQVQGILQSLPKLIPVTYKKVDYVIDGANVLYYGSRDINTSSYIQLDNLIKRLHRDKPDSTILLVLHQRHFNFKPYMTAIKDIVEKWWKHRTLQICITPRGQNDDHYSIYHAVYCNAMVITNDKFLDHINKVSSLLKTWTHEMIINYDINSITGDIKFNWPLQYSRRHQRDDKYYYAPVDSGVNHWYVTSVNRSM